MLSSAIQDKLNEQLGHELYSAYLYYAMSAYFDSVNLDGFANWMKIQAQEELIHVDKIFTYINNRGGRVRFAAVAAPTNEWASPVAAMQDSYKHECFISGKINECVSLALSAAGNTLRAVRVTASWPFTRSAIMSVADGTPSLSLIVDRRLNWA